MSLRKALLEAAKRVQKETELSSAIKKKTKQKRRRS
tara:strand:+ start:323 stop:430 length:108 start_codon:yes stop_codon:yes gene_type:complete